jgi:hypothetical protein
VDFGWTFCSGVYNFSFPSNFLFSLAFGFFTISPTVWGSVRA